MKNRNDRLSKTLLSISVILGIAFLVTLFLLINQFSDSWGRRDDGDTNPTITNETERYALRQNATPYQIELFEDLLAAHDQFEQWGSDESLEAYAAAIVQNFIADFYTLSNKNNRNNVGGIQFFSEEIADVFTTHAINEFYLYLNQHIETFGSEALPTVQSIEITGVEFAQRPIESEEDESAEGYGYGHGIPENIEYERVVIVYANWTYEATTLPGIDEFQTSARFTLRITEEGVFIYIVEEVQEQFPYGS